MWLLHTIHDVSKLMDSEILLLLSLYSSWNIIITIIIIIIIASQYTNEYVY